jgi:hypothetical protein
VRSLSGCVRRALGSAKAVTCRKLNAVAANIIDPHWLRFRCGPIRTPALTGLLVALTLCGCSGSKVIDLYTADYRDTTATSGDSQLLLNILRAKDGLPIHFYDLSIIHGSLQSTAGAIGTIPFPLQNPLTAPAIAPALAVQSSPTFDLGTSDTQDFTRGILSQLDPLVVKALFDEGVDPRIMMLLFFSEYRFPSGKILLNTMACDPSWPGKHPDRGCYYQIYDYLKLIDDHLEDAKHRAGLGDGFEAKIQANLYSVLRPVGSPLVGAWTLTNFGDLRQLDTTKYRVINNRLFSISAGHLALCYTGHGALHSLFPEQYPDSACTHGEIIEPIVKKPVGLALRSTYDIIQFLGQVLKFQEEANPGECLVLDNVREDHRRCDSGNVLFQVNAPNGTPVIGTRYGDGWYALSDRHCRRRWNEACDYSTQVLAILEMLINENKQAKDIISTPRVQVVP